MKTIHLEHPNNEASALLGVQNHSLVADQNWKFAFWTASDELPLPDALSLLGYAGDGEWQIRRVKARISGRGAKKNAEDCECLARAGSWIYVFGSNYGAKEGPLEPKRHFVLRFNEALVTWKNGDLRVDAEVARVPFLLHRLINDAIKKEQVEVLPAGEHLQHDMIDATRKQAKKEKKKWLKLLKRDDVPINIEGATFLHGGHLLLGLRHPVTIDGNPMLVEIEGIDRMFDDDARDPQVIGIRVVKNVGSKSSPAGIRELDSVRDVVHVITGSLESSEKSDVVQDHPEGALAKSEHWIVPLEPLRRGVVGVKGKLERRFKSSSVEGMALEGQRVWYVCDADDIVLHVAELDPEVSRA